MQYQTCQSLTLMNVLGFFSTSVQAEWNFLAQTLPDLEDALDFPDAKLTGKFLTSLIGRPPSEDERQLSSLLARKVGLGKPIIRQIAERNFKTSSEAIKHVKSASFQNTNFDWASTGLIIENLKPMLPRNLTNCTTTNSIA